MKKNRNVIFLGLTSLFTDISSEMMFPILPLFLSSTLGLNKAFIGLIQGIAEGTSSILKFVSGYISDKVKKRKAIVTLGYTLSNLSKPLLSMVTNGYEALALRFTDRVGKGIRDAPRDALLSESTKKRGSAFGLQTSLDTLGAAIGNILAFLLLYYVTSNYRDIFKYSLIPGLIAILIVSLFVKDVKLKTQKKYKLKKIKLSKKFKLFLFISSLFSFANISYAFFILKAQDLSVTAALIPIVYLVYNIVYSLTAYPIGRYSDKHSKVLILGMGYLLFSLVSLGFALASSSALVWLLFAMFGVHMAIYKSVSRAFVSDLIPKREHGTGFGVYHTTVGLSLLPGNFLAGMLWDKFGSTYTFLFASILSVLACISLITLFRRELKKT